MTAASAVELVRVTKRHGHVVAVDGINLKIRAAEVPVLALEARQAEACGRIEAQIEAARRDDGAEAVVLGCAGMAALAEDLTTRHGLPVIDGVTAAVALAEALVRLGLRTSKLGGYAAPPPKRGGAGCG